VEFPETIKNYEPHVFLSRLFGRSDNLAWSLSSVSIFHLFYFGNSALLAMGTKLNFQGLDGKPLTDTI